MINASLLQEHRAHAPAPEQLATERSSGQAGSSSSLPPPPGRALQHMPKTEQLFTATDKEVLDLVERGEEQLLREAASKAYKLKQHYNNRGRIELGMTELSHLHAQLNKTMSEAEQELPDDEQLRAFTIFNLSPVQLAVRVEYAENLELRVTEAAER